MVLVVKNLLLPMQTTWVQSLGWEDPLEEGMATHSSTLAWRILWTEEPGGLYYQYQQWRGFITADPLNIKRIIKKYCEQLYAHNAII